MNFDIDTHPGAAGRQQSRGLLARARRTMPGGVSSPVRAYSAVDGEPVVIERGEGPWMEDADGNRYLDMSSSWGPLILGHAHPEVTGKVKQAVDKGLSFGATSKPEIELAEEITSRISFIDKIRFVNSGTEAVLGAVRAARGMTGRDKVLKFNGCYHGHGDYLLVEAGSGLTTFGTPSSAGVPEAFTGQTLVGELADPDGVRDLVEEAGDDLAAIILEPLPANAGLLEQDGEFLRELREICDESGALLVFDEVITGFRLGTGGAADEYGVTPDLVTYGKVIGGGMPVGAYAGPDEVMQHVAPLGPVYQAGTLSGNPVTMTAGLATLKQLDRSIYRELEEKTEQLTTGLSSKLSKHSVPGKVARKGSIFWLHLSDGDLPARKSEVSEDAIERYNRLHPILLDEGLYFPPSGWEVCFLSTVHREEEIELAVEKFGKALERFKG